MSAIHQRNQNAICYTVILLAKQTYQSNPTTSLSACCLGLISICCSPCLTNGPVVALCGGPVPLDFDSILLCLLQKMCPTDLSDFAIQTRTQLPRHIATNWRSQAHKVYLFQSPRVEQWCWTANLKEAYAVHSTCWRANYVRLLHSVILSHMLKVLCIAVSRPAHDLVCCRSATRSVKYRSEAK